MTSMINNLYVMDELSRSGSVASLFYVNLRNKATERNVDPHDQIIEGSMGHTRLSQ